MDNNNKKTINNNNNNVEKMGETRTKPTRDITQIYTQGKKKSITGLLPTRKFLLAAPRTFFGGLSPVAKAKSNYRGEDQNPAIQNFLFIFSLIILM